MKTPARDPDTSESRRARQADARSVERAALDAESTKPIEPTRRVLIAVDLAEGSEDVIRRGAEMFVGAAGGLQDVLAHVICSFDQLLSQYLCAKPGPELQSALAIEAKARLSELGRTCIGPSPSTRREVVLTGVPWKELITAAKTHRCDVLVVGTPMNRDSSSRLLGSTVERILLDSPCPVVVLPPTD